jgi:hypothetical protein
MLSARNVRIKMIAPRMIDAAIDSTSQGGDNTAGRDQSTNLPNRLLQIVAMK